MNRRAATTTRRPAAKRGGRAWLRACCAAGALLLAATAATAAVRVQDDLGQSIELAAPARRVVSLAPHATELMFAVGAGAQLVGTEAYSDYPPEVARVPRIGNYDSIDLEALLALRPDLVLAWHSGNGERLIARLRALGLTVFVSEPRRLADIPTTMERLGRLTGHAAEAEAAAAAFRARHDALVRRYSSRPPLRVFYQIWDQPLMTVNGEHIISQVLGLCGGRNVFAALPPLVPTVDVEAVLAANPEAIVASGADARRPEWLNEWKRWPSLTAVRRHNLISVPPDLIQRHSPRILDGAQQLCQELEQARGKRR